MLKNGPDGSRVMVGLLSQARFLMRVLFCKIHCSSFICFEPPPHTCISGPLKLEDTPHVPSKLVSVPEASDQLPCRTSDGIQHPTENCRRSCLKKPNEEQQKKRVQWMDLLGKELVAIREFESRFALSLSLFALAGISSLMLYTYSF